MKAGTELKVVRRGSLFGHGFTQVPNMVLDSPRLLPGPKCLYALLLRFAWQKGETFVSQRKLAALCGVDERTIRRWMQELVVVKLIRATRPCRHKTNTYIIEEATAEVRAALGVEGREQAGGGGCWAGSDPNQPPATADRTPLPAACDDARWDDDPLGDDRG